MINLVSYNHLFFLLFYELSVIHDADKWSIDFNINDLISRNPKNGLKKKDEGCQAQAM